MTEPMQFDTNDDFPPNPCQNPVSFPDPVIGQCTRITTRIYNTDDDTITMARDCVLVPPVNIMRDNEDSASSSTDRSSSFDDDDDDDDIDDRNGEDMDQDIMDHRPSSYYSGPPLPFSTTHEPRAYWIQRDIREAIFGRVCLGEVLKRRPNDTYVEWETTGVRCAIKEMSWEMIREQEHALAENPVQEVAAMQYLQRFCFRNLSGQQPQEQQHQQQQKQQESNVHVTVQQMMDTKIMMSLDVLSDDRHLYSIMPYADGQELFDYVDEKGKFTEEESRYWMLQILEGVESLQRAGVCHRDMSLENLLTDRQRRCLIIDMGMCLKIPYLHNNNDDHHHQEGTELLTENRCLIQRQTRCGKWPYISPEILNNQEFDGHAVDMWAVGVILFMMVAGFPPWDRACDSDSRFKYMSRGYTSQILTQWQLGLSPDLMDLMQRMFAINPRHRLSLQQVRAHPWMNGPVDVPL